MAAPAAWYNPRRFRSARPLRRILLIILPVAVVALLATQLRLQRSGTAHVVARGSDVRALTGMIAWRGGFRGATCDVPVDADRVLFERVVPVATKYGDASVGVRFRYLPPRGSLPSLVRQGDWCSSLASAVEQQLTAAVLRTGVDLIVADRREAAHRVEGALTASLAAAGLQAERVAVRIDITDDFRRALPRADVVAKAERRPPVLFVGLDGADWQLLEQLMQQGVMPNLARLVREGRSGDLSTMHPPLSPLLWTTMMTGVGPLQHRILDFTRFHPATRVKEPITSDERRAPAIWNVDTYAGRTTGVFGLWATYPSEPINGMMVSDRMVTSIGSAQSPPYLVYPPSAAAACRTSVSRAEQRVDLALMQQYMPWLDRDTYEEKIKVAEPWGNPIAALRRTLVETYTYHDLGTTYWRTARPDLLIVYLQGTDVVGHIFAPYYPPRQANVSPEDFARYSGVPARYFAEVDRLLGEYRQLAADSGAVLMLASDHGFLWFEGRPTQLSSAAAATAAKWHRSEGIWLLWGKGIAPAARGTLPAAQLLQVAPTLTALTGAPRATSSTASPLGGIAANGQQVDYAAIFEPWVPPLAPVTAAGNEEDIAKLRALGYIGSQEPLRAAAQNSAAPTRTGGSFNNEGLLLRNAKQTDAAVRAFEQAIAIDPSHASSLWNLSELLWQEKRDEQRSNDLLIKAVANGLPEGEKFIIGRAIAYQRSGHVDRSLALLDSAIRAIPSSAELYLFRGRYRVDANACGDALDDFRNAQRLRPRDANAYASAAIAALCLGDRAEAERQMQQAARLDPRAAQGMMVP